MRPELPPDGAVVVITIIQRDDLMAPCDLCRMRAAPTYELELDGGDRRAVILRGDAPCVDVAARVFHLIWPEAAVRTRRVYAPENPWGAWNE